MRIKLPVSAVVAVLVVAGATASWAEKGSGKSKKDAVVPESINRQFQWEEKVVGPKDGVDHKKIAAMQEQARREDAARKNDPPKKQARAEGISAPASAVPPTMDIEKPAPAGSVRKPAAAKKAIEPPRHRDALDNLLAEEGSKPPPRTSPAASASSRNALGSVLAVDDQPKPAPARTMVATRAPAKKHPHKRHRR